jgi:hypothetical protein
MSETIEESRLDEMVRKYIELRDRKAELKRAYDKSVDDIDATLAKCESFFLAEMRRLGLKALPTTDGIAYQENRVSVTVADRNGFLDFARSNEAWDLMDIRASKKNIEQYRQDHDDLPPGINWREEVVVNVRRK